MMKTSPMKWMGRSLKGLGLAGLVLGSSAVFAQQSACVSLLVGAGYAAWMRVVSGDYATDWSDSFPIGQTRCKSLAAIADGQPYTVQISAVLGSSKVPCQPANLKRVASVPGSVTYQAWGTTLNVKCEMPSADGVSNADTSVMPNKAGKAAAQKLKSHGDTLKPE